MNPDPAPESPAEAQQWPLRGIHAPHLWGCPLNSRGGVCTCPDLRTTGRGMTYDLATLLGEGIHEDEGDEE